MVLLDDVVQVAARAHDDRLRPRIILAQQPQRTVARDVAVRIDLARPVRQMRGRRFAKECLRGVDAAVGTQKMVDRLAVLIDRPIQVVPSASYGNRGFVDPPRAVHAARVSRPSLLELRHVAQHPAQNRRVRHVDPALSHHGDQVPIAQPARDVPTNAELNDLSLEPASAVDRVARYCSCHSAPRKRPKFDVQPVNAPEPIFRAPRRASTATHGNGNQQDAG